jgi:tagatose 1,6-diphosphate aldolase
MIAVFQKGKIFPMFAFDHRGSFVKLLTGTGTEPSLQEITEVKRNILQAVVPYMSGTLIDEDYGLPALQSMHSLVPYLLPLEKTGYTDKQGERITEILATPKQLIEKGAQGAKLLLYVNHNVPSWTAQIKTAKNQMYVCKEANLPFFLELVLYTVGDIKPGTVYETVKRAIQDGVTCDVWKLPYPGSKLECEKITDLVGGTPWIVLTGGTTFEEFKEQYFIARDAGCSGFLAGRALWQEVGELWRDEQKYRDFLQNELPSRFKQLIA